MNVPLVDLKAQYKTIKPQIDAAIQRIVDGTSFILGKEVTSFEEAFAAYCGVRHCIGVGSGTAAIHLALLAAGVGPGDEVITTPFTFIATAGPIWMVGAKPVFVDIDLLSYAMDPDRVEAAITARTRAIMPVHLYGHPADMDPILDIADRHGLTVIEDAAQAHGAEYRGRRVGTMGRLACFSFYPGKNLGAYGDAGAVVTDDAALAQHVTMLRDHGRRSKYEHEFMGYGERLDAMQAAILAAKLPYLEEWTERRRQAAARYNALLAGADVVLPHEAEHVRAVYHIYALRTRRRDALLKHLNGLDIGAGIHYPIALHRQPALAYLGLPRGSFPAAATAAAEELSLPLYPEITEEQLTYVAGAVTGFLSEATES
jgi:dTDP-4-amino-4,6-dideoxygalactose transaminase